MRYISELRGKPVISIATGRQIGRVADVLLDEARGRVIGLIVRRGRLGGEQVLPFDEVEGVGHDAVIARHDNALVGAREWNRRGLHAPRGSSLTDTHVITATGRQIGSICDVRLDERDGAVTGYDMMTFDSAGRHPQRSLIPHADVVAAGPDAIVVPEATADALRPADRPPG